MLSRWVRVVVIALFVTSCAVVTGGPASAATTCAAGETPVERTDAQGVTKIVCEKAKGGEGDGEGNGEGNGDEAGGPRTCMLDSEIYGYEGLEIPCSDDFFGVWNAGLQCYMSEFTGNIPQDSPVWEGNDDGYIVTCTIPDCVLSSPSSFPGTCSGPVWTPDAPTVGPSAEELAERAAARLQTGMGEIGSTPPAGEGSSGVVGAPIWLWVDDPGGGTTERVSATESDGGLEVTAEATLDRIEWELADESGEVYRSTTCEGSDASGTDWFEGDFGTGPSPTCGFPGEDNTRSGRVTLTGTAYWTVEWSGGGQDGTIDVTPQDRSVELEVAEVQVLTQ